MAQPKILIDAFWIFARRDNSRQIKPVPMRQIATDQLLNKTRHRSGFTMIVHAHQSAHCAEVLPNNCQVAKKMGLFTANPEPVIK
jgi:hypothetical protein